MDTFAYAEVRPPELNDVIRCVWTLRGPAVSGAPPEPIVPDGSVEVLINLGDTMEHRLDSGDFESQDRVVMAGQGTRPIVVRPTGRIEMIGIRLQPWASRAVIDLPSYELRDQIHALGGPVRTTFDSLACEVADIPDDTNRLDAVVRRLSRVARRGDAHIGRAAVGMVREAETFPSVRQLAARIGVTMRTIQRVFANDVGMSPKTLLRIARVQRAIRIARQSPRLRWSSVAAHAGYHDQSHLIRDFRELAGSLPSEFVPRESGFTESMLET
jgi:AraC-like DNA-binding protein